MAPKTGLYANIHKKRARIKRQKAAGRIMSGKTHTASSKFLVHKKDLSATAKKVANA